MGLPASRRGALEERFQPHALLGQPGARSLEFHAPAGDPAMKRRQFIEGGAETAGFIVEQRCGGGQQQGGTDGVVDGRARRDQGLRRLPGEPHEGAQGRRLVGLAAGQFSPQFGFPAGQFQEPRLDAGYPFFMGLGLPRGFDELALEAVQLMVEAVAGLGFGRREGEQQADGKSLELKPDHGAGRVETYRS